MTTRIFLCVSAILALSSSARATVLIPADLGELSRDARAIAYGRVVALDPQRTDDRGTIETMVTLEVEAYLKGALGSTLRFRTPGGDLGRFRSVVVGAPEFAVDERVVVFLGARGPSVPYVLGLSQGVYRVVRSASSGWVVTPPASLAVAAAPVPIVRGDPSRRAVSLNDFAQRVRELAAGTR